MLAAELYDLTEVRQRAAELIQAQSEIRHDSWEREPEINARTALFEALTAKGHLSVIESDEPLEHVNQLTLRRLLNGWDDRLPQFEKDRRFSEIVEELVIHQVAQDISAGYLPEDTIVFTISNSAMDKCSDEKLLSNLGYGVLNDKGMVRATSFENGVRTVEQVSRSNSNDGSAERFFATHGLIVGHGSDRILANQIISTKQHFPKGVIDVQRALDYMAGPNVIYGEDRDQPDLNVPDYEDLRAVSQAREEQAHIQIQKLADFERELNVEYKAGKISYAEKLAALYKRRKELVAEICLLAPHYAKDAMGEAAAVHIEKASYEMAAGNDAVGVQHMENALAAANPLAGAVCGGNGLENKLANQNNLSSEARRLYPEAKQDRKFWKWTRGICNVKECPTRPAKTDVGPCSVCRKCQAIFDAGKSPNSIYKTRGLLDLLFDAFSEENQRYKAQKQAKRVASLKKAA